MPAPVRQASPTSNPTEPPDHGPTITFMRSSQARHWRYSAEQIRTMRLQSNEAACLRLRKIWEKERSLMSVENEPESSSSSEAVTFTTVDEEQAIIRYYLTRVHQLVKAFGLSESVEATTITYIKRFYLRNTCMDHHPKNVMLTCLFLAAKAESNPVLLKQFSTKLAGKGATEAAIQEYASSVQDLEFLISQSLSFQFMVYGAHRALHGLILDAQETVQPPLKSTELRALIEPARNNLKQSRFTDAEFIYTPSQIALACVRSASSTGRDMVDRYLEAKSKRAREVRVKDKAEREKWKQKTSKSEQSSNGSTSKETEPSVETTELASTEMAEDDLGSVLDDIEQLIQDKMRTAGDDVEQVKTIDKKLKLCQNPESAPNSRIYASREREKKEALLRKRKGTKTSLKEEDPFADDEEGNIGEMKPPQAKRAKAT